MSVFSKEKYSSTNGLRYREKKLREKMPLNVAIGF